MKQRIAWFLLIYAAGMVPLLCADGVQQVGAADTAPKVHPTTLPENLATRKAGDDWTRFLGPSGDSKSRERGILTKWPHAGPRLVWQHSLGAGYGMPAVSRGRLLQFDRQRDQARLVCLNSETGKEIWRFEYHSDYADLYGYDNGPRTSPVIDEDRVYIFGVEGMLHCLNVETGAVVWKVDTREKFSVVQNFFGVGSTPLVFGDLLICQIGGSSDDTRSVPAGQLDRVRGKDSGVVAFDKRTGAVKYQASDELASYASPFAARIGDRDWCFVFARGGLLGFDPANGKIDFHFPWRAPILESVNASNPVVVDDLVFVSEAYSLGSALLRVRAGGYDVVWSDRERRRDKSLQTHWNTPIHHQGYLYGSSGRHAAEAELKCIELATGKVMWSQPGLGRSSLLYVDDHFVLLTESGELILLKATTERFEAVTASPLELPPEGAGVPGLGPRKLLNFPAWAAPILSHGLLYVRGRDRLACLELIPEK